MAEIIRLPKLGLSDWGEIVEWQVTEGDRIETGDVIAILESDKSSVDIEATAGGVLLATYVDQGEEIQIEPGRPIAAVGDPGESVPDPDAAGTEAATSSGSQSTTSSNDQNTSTDASTDNTTKITPKARKTASDHGIDPSSISGTGPEGAITATDVERYLEESNVDSSDDTQPSDDDSIPYTISEVRDRSPLQRTVADQLTKSAREKPHVKGSVTISIESLERALNEQSTDKVDVSLNDLLLRAVALTLQEHPRFNAVFENDEYRLIEEINLGYAVDTDRGLVVPVIERADQLSVPELAERRERMVGRVLGGQYEPRDLQGATFTVNNVGALGLETSFSIINPPQVAILVIGRRQPELFERDGEVVTERAVTISLILDHRVLDGGDASRFLQTLEQYIENPPELFE